jgi:cytochrome P450
MLTALVAENAWYRAKMPILGEIDLVTRHAAIHAVLKDKDRFVVDARHAGHKVPFGMPFLPKSLKIMADNVLSMDDPDHARLRRLADAPFRRAAILTQRRKIHACAHELLDLMETDRQHGSGLRLLPSATPESDLRLARLPAGNGGKALPHAQQPDGHRFAVHHAVGPVPAGSHPGHAARGVPRPARKPREGLVSELVHAEADGQKMTENELLAMVFVLFVAGHETTTHLFSSGIWTLLTQPGAADAVRGHGRGGSPHRGGRADALLHAGPDDQAAFRERRYGVRGQGAEARRPRIRLSRRREHGPGRVRRPAQTLNLARRPNRHVGFGSGAHICLGIHLARLEGEVALDVLLSRYPHLAIEGVPDNVKWIAPRGPARPETLAVDALLKPAENQHIPALPKPRSTV